MLEKKRIGYNKDMREFVIYIIILITVFMMSLIAMEVKAYTYQDRLMERYNQVQSHLNQLNRVEALHTSKRDFYSRRHDYKSYSRYKRKVRDARNRRREAAHQMNLLRQEILLEYEEPLEQI